MARIDTYWLHDMHSPTPAIRQSDRAHTARRHSFALVVAHLVLVASVCSPLAAHGNENTTKAPRFVREWGQQGSENGEFDFPIGIAINSADEIFVTDFTNARVQKFTSDGKFLSAFAVSPFPGGIALDHDGDVYIAHFGIPPSHYEGERKRDKVAVFSATGELLREWGKTGDADGEFDLPGDIAISHDGRVYVADQCNRRIQVFDTQGKFLTKWGRKGFQPGEFGGAPHPKAFFAGPTFLACDKQGNVFTTEAPLCRVQKFTADGKHLLAWGDNGTGPGKFGDKFTGLGHGNMLGPTGICFDAQGRLWCNAIGGRIQQFSDTGEYLSGFGEEGTEPGQFYAPHGLAIDSQGCLYIVDAFNHRIQKFDVTP
jgi:DNA-binding beta-propeller fold protein YncE